MTKQNLKKTIKKTRKQFTKRKKPTVLQTLSVVSSLLMGAGVLTEQFPQMMTGWAWPVLGLVAQVSPVAAAVLAVLASFVLVLAPLVATWWAWTTAKK